MSSIKSDINSCLVSSPHLLNGPIKSGIHYLYEYFCSRYFSTTFTTIPLSPRLFWSPLGAFYRDLLFSSSSPKEIIHFTPFFPHAFLKQFQSYLFNIYLKMPFFDIRSKLRAYNLLKPDILFSEGTLALSLHSCVQPTYFIVRASDSLRDLRFSKQLYAYCISKMKQASLILTASNAIKMELIDEGINPDILKYLPNGVDTSLYEYSYLIPNEYKYITMPIAVYIGSINTVDHCFLAEVARLTPNVYYFVIGPITKNISTFRNSPNNVFYSGFRPYSQLPAYLQHASVGIVPVSRKRLGAIERPRKLYQYLAAGIPVVSIKGPHSQQTKYVSLVDSAQEFASAVDSYIATPIQKNDIKFFAKSNFSWNSVYKELDNLLITLTNTE